MSEFRMPSLGADMEAGTLVEWTKHPGDAVKRGDIIAVVDTQKGAIEVEVWEDGVLETTLVDAGQKVPVGTVLAIVRGTGPEPAPTPVSAPVVSVVHPAPQAAASTSAPARKRISPLARKLAAELGVDLARITGTGSQGAVTHEDVERAAHAAGRPPSSMRAAIAAAMARSKREIPHYYLATTIDMSAAMTWLGAENNTRPMSDRLLPAALCIKAVALALREAPDLNGYWTDNAFHPGPGIHIGITISLRGGGLVAPALHDADRLDLATVMRQLRDLVARARAGSLRSSELTDPTITLTNLGDQGAESTFGIIYPPQVAIVGFGRIASRPWIAGEAVVARPLMTATLSGDHRATDGHRGGVFLAAVARWLQSPEKL